MYVYVIYIKLTPNKQKRYRVALHRGYDVPVVYI